MKRASRHAILLATVLAVAALAACDKGGGTAAAKSYPDTAAGFDQYANDLVATVKDNREAQFVAMAKDLALPDAKAWFAETFGTEAGARMLAEYDGYGLAKFDGAWKDMRGLVVEQGRNTVHTTRHTDPKDDLATGYQANALRTMVKPTALYRLQLTRPDGEKSFTLWSFVYVDGKFRLAGHMKQAVPSDPNEDMAKELDMLGELPIVEARRIMQEWKNR
jgi:hypothetical protein